MVAAPDAGREHLIQEILFLSACPWLVSMAQESPEVDKDALRSLGAKVAHLVAAGPDAGLEHQVEGEGGTDVVPRVRGLDPVLCESSPQAWRVQLFHCGQHMLDFLQVVLESGQHKGEDLAGISSKGLAGSSADCGPAGRP